MPKGNLVSREVSFETKAYHVKLKDKDAQLNSLSRGAFTDISDNFLSQGRAVSCSCYNYEKYVRGFKLTTEGEIRNQARNFKYILSTSRNIFDQCVLWIKYDPERSAVL